MSFTYEQLKDRVRTLTGVWSTDVVSDALVYNLLSDAVTALERSQNWDTVSYIPPGLTFVKYTGNATVTPGTNWTEYHVILSYRVASQVLAFEADDTPRAQFFAQEYDKMYAEMVEHFLPRAAKGSPTDTMSMVRYVRDLTGQYGEDLPDTLVAAWLNEIYQEVFAMYDWPTSGSPSWATAPTLVDGGSPVNPTIVGAPEFLTAFCYFTAAKMMASAPEAQARAAVYKAEYDRIFASMLSKFFPALTVEALDTEAQLVDHVRFLTQNYTRALTDALIVQYLKNAQKELVDRNYWGGAVTSTFVSGVPVEYRRVLTLRAAARILNGTVPEAQVGALVGEYDAVVEEMKTTLVRNASLGAGASTTFGDLKKHFRMLTGVWDNTISDTAIGNWLNDAYTELAQDKPWPWLSVTDTQDYTLSAGTSKISLDSELRTTTTKTVQLSTSPVISGTLVLSEDEGQQKWEFTTSVQPDSLAKPVDLIIVATHALYGDEITFTMDYNDTLDKYIGYRNLTLSGTWNIEISVVLVGGVIVIGQYLVANTSIVVPTSISRRVLGVYFLGGNYDGVPDQWLAAPHLLDIEEYAPRTVYDIAEDGVLRWAPELSESGVLRVQYVRNVTALSSDSDQPLFAARFRPILAYRAAMRWASMGGDKNRVQTFQSEFQSMLEQMVNEYLLDHDSNPLQLGSEGLETRRYLPWFRTA